jgi:hypothetical protein
MRLGTCLGVFSSALLCAAAIGCSSSDTGTRQAQGTGTGSTSSGNGGTLNGTGSTSGTGSVTGLGADTGSGGTGNSDNPATCDAAATARSYVGCDFWPTVTYNPVYSEFQFAVVVANGGTVDADVTVDGPNNVATSVGKVTVMAGGLQTIILPWVTQLKGPEFSRVNTSGGRANTSVSVPGGAYHLTSTVPVTAWQYNPLQYKLPIGQVPSCGTNFDPAYCFSASNDASLLLPSTAMTGSYRVFARSGDNAGDWGSASSNMAITATAANTTVTIQYPAACAAGVNSGTGMCTVAGTGIAAAAPGDKQTFMMNAGDVIEIGAAWGADQSGGPVSKDADLSGTIINSTSPVQVISLNPISTVPNATVGNADHFEETVLPSEVIGKSYLVAPPTTPNGAVKGGHIVRIYGNEDGTNLTYKDGAPSGAPTMINAGETVEFGPITTSFEVDGDKPFAVGSFMLGGALQGSGNCPGYPCPGDPSFSMEVTPEQFRKTYTFLAPTDYDTNFADILVPTGAAVTLDGAPLAGTPEPVGTSGWGVVRAPLNASTGGIHTVSTTDDKGVGLQIMGFGHATSYYTPGGLNLKLISNPVTIK